LIPEAPLPRAADPEVLGSIPLRAYRFCEPFTAASGYGWWVYPPIDLDVMWDGHAMSWRPQPERDWHAVGDVILSSYRDDFERRLSSENRHLSQIPFLGRGPEPGILQVWGGLLARTHPDWSLLVRPLANYPRDGSYELLEGMIETDWWFGPLIALFRIVKTDRVVEFRTTRPMLQLQPVYRQAYSRESISSVRFVRGVEAMGEEEWDHFMGTLSLRNHHDGEVRGSYKRELRARARSRSAPPGDDPPALP
jgi:Family of unknown function (DUF6065)